jgi:hypothetical protein
MFKTIVDEAVRDVERHVMLWDDDHTRQIDNQSSFQQIVVKRFLKYISNILVSFLMF